MGMTKLEMLGEIIGGVCVFALPIILLFIGHALGLK